jgi:hypothetical protein
MQSITHQLSPFGQNDGGIVLALAFKFVVGITVMYIKVNFYFLPWPVSYLTYLARLTIISKLYDASQK